jgi:hypothetical protein
MSKKLEPNGFLCVFVCGWTDLGIGVTSKFLNHGSSPHESYHTDHHEEWMPLNLVISRTGVCVCGWVYVKEKE